MDHVDGTEALPAESRSRRNLTYIVGGVILALAALAVVLIVSGLVGDSEPDFVFDLRTGEFEFEEPVSPDPDLRSRVLAVNADSGEVLWETDVPGSAWAMDFAPDGLMFASAGQLRGTPGIVSVGFDGQPRWQVSLSTVGWGTLAYQITPLDDGDLVIATRTSGAGDKPALLARVDAANGDAIWTTNWATLSAIQIEVLDDVVITLHTGVGFVGIDSMTGAVIWETPFTTTMWQWSGIGHIEPPDRVDNGVAYFSVNSEESGGILGVDATGNIELEIEVPRQTEVIRVDRGAMFTMQNPKTVSRYSTATGEQEWTRNGGTTSIAFETFGDIALIKAGAARRILGVNVESGDVIWRLDSDRYRIWTSADLKHFYVWNEDEPRNKLQAIDARSGEEAWSFPARGLMRQEALIHGNVVFAATRDRAASGVSGGRGSSFAALDATTGAELWTLDLELGFEWMQLDEGSAVLYILTTLG